MNKLFLMISLCLGSIAFSQTLTRVNDPEDYSTTTDNTIGYQNASIEYNYKRYLKFKKLDSTFAVYEFDGTTYTEFTANGNISPTTVEGTGIIALNVDIQHPDNLYFIRSGDDGIANFYKWNGTELITFSNPSGISASGITGWFLGTINGELLTFSKDETDSYNVLLKQNGTALEVISLPEGYEDNGLTYRIGNINTIDNIAYFAVKNDNGLNDLILYDGENFSVISTPAGYDGSIDWRAMQLDDRHILIPYKNSTDQIIDLFVFDLTTESLTQVTGISRTNIANNNGSLYPSHFELNEEHYFTYNHTSTNSTIYKLDIENNSATEIIAANTVDYKTVWASVNTVENIAFFHLEGPSNNDHYVSFDGTSLTYLDMPSLNGTKNWKHTSIAKKDDFGQEKIYFALTNLNGGLEVSGYNNGVKLLYSYDIATNTFSSAPIESDDGIVFNSWQGFIANGSFILGEDIYHTYKNTNQARLLYKEEDICTEQINPTPIAISTTASSYIVPSGNYSITTDGTYQDTITTVAGCDSIITLEVSFVAPPSITNLSIVESASSTAAEITDKVYTEGETIVVKISYSDEVAVSTVLNSYPTIEITSIDKELTYHSQIGSDIFFTYTVSADENINTQLSLADEIILNGGEILNKNLDNSVSTDISSVNNLGSNLLTSANGALDMIQKAISPNPFSDYIHFDLEILEGASITIKDMNGKLVKKAENMPSINTDDLANGIYLMYIESDTYSTYMKLIKN